MTKRSAAASAETVKEFVVRTFEELDIANFAVTQRVKQKKDDKTPEFFHASYDHQKLVINLTPGKSWFKLPWAIQAQMYFDQQEAETPKVQNATAKVLKEKEETLKVQVEIGEAVSKVLKALEDVVQTKVQAAIPDVKWISSVKTLDGGDLFTAKLVLTAPDERRLTHCTVRPFKKDVVKVAGKELLEPLLQAHRGFAKSKLKMVVTLHNVWLMEDKQMPGKRIAGVSWRVTNLVADLPEQVEYVFQDVFKDVVFDDEEEED